MKLNLFFVLLYVCLVVDVGLFMFLMKVFLNLRISRSFVKLWWFWSLFYIRGLWNLFLEKCDVLWYSFFGVYGNGVIENLLLFLIVYEKLIFIFIMVKLYLK